MSPPVVPSQIAPFAEIATRALQELGDASYRRVLRAAQLDHAVGDELVDESLRPLVFDRRLGGRRGAIAVTDQRPCEVARRAIVVLAPGAGLAERAGE